MVKQSSSGFTLLELVVGMGIFSLVVLSATAIFQKVVEGQSMAIAAQNTQEAMRFASEAISKEIRMAERDFDGKCNDGEAGEVFAVRDSNTKLYFRNEYGECVAYASINNFFVVSRIPEASFSGVSGHNSNYDDITPDEINVSNLKFYERGDLQEAVTITMTVNSKGRYLLQSQMDMETTISSRYYLESKLNE